MLHATPGGGGGQLLLVTLYCSLLGIVLPGRQDHGGPEAAEEVLGCFMQVRLQKLVRATQTTAQASFPSARPELAARDVKSMSAE
jgi:hypothetical protein